MTGGAGAAETDLVFELSGMMAALKQEGAEFFDHNRAPFVEVPLEYDPALETAGPQKTVMVNPRVLEYETLVAVSQLKMHDAATVTLALRPMRSQRTSAAPGFFNRKLPYRHV